MEIDGLHLVWLGHAGFKVKSNNIVIYIDPYQIEEDEKADIVLITHDHYDHCSKEDVEKIMKDDTIIVCNEASAKKLGVQAKIIDAGKTIDVMGIKITAVPAYNIGKEFHPKGYGLGFIIDIAGKRIYHAGDTDVIPEMRDIKDIDIALFPVGGTYTMNAEEAVEAAELIKPRIAIPMHYGSIVGTANDAELFKELYSGRAYILKKGL
ncbi:MAG: MBL fold metallo-hydrolase [Candidatus Diapherotrites archaeon]|nr:MBL fold metallo-hydrolase [Candidatus Diapherotrites archaeon]